jgi:hypothetical protein
LFANPRTGGFYSRKTIQNWSYPAPVDGEAFGSLPHAAFFLSYSIGDA